jgi:hypothetical protein
MAEKGMISTISGVFVWARYSAEHMFSTLHLVFWCAVEGMGGRNVENGGLNTQKYTVFI